MANTVSVTMEDLRRELIQMKQRVEQLRAQGDSGAENLQRWVVEAEKVLSRWDGGREQ